MKDSNQQKSKTQLVKSSTELSLTKNNPLLNEISRAYIRVNGAGATSNKEQLKQQLIQIAEDIETFVPKKANDNVVTPEHIKEAIKCGSTGLYGEYYKFTGLIVCSWVRKYLEELPWRVKGNEEQKWEMWNTAIETRIEKGETREQAINQLFSRVASETIGSQHVFYDQLIDDKYFEERKWPSVPIDKLRNIFQELKNEFLKLDKKYNEA